VTYSVNGKVHYGVVKNNTSVVDLSSRLPYPDIVAFIAAEALPEAERLAQSEKPDHLLKDLTFLPVVPNPGKIVCIGVNYEDHRLEAGRDRTDHPMVFGRWPESQTGHLQPIMRSPRVSTQLDYEGELMVVIGKRIPRYTNRQDALAYVFGYSCYNEACNRDFQFHTRQLMPGKNFESTGACGPWIVTADEIPDPQSLHLQLRLNGKVMQDANTKDMVWPIPVLIEYITMWLPLNPGDLIVSGTPGGVGFKRNPPVFMQNGDVAEVEIEKIGVLRNSIKDEP
jgi:2-keto-4-pentenoate hydratase/2-oxohepta-3-ene-1,7-dioic acid hydratase in catechol pathway